VSAVSKVVNLIFSDFTNIIIPLLRYSMECYFSWALC